VADWFAGSGTTAVVAQRLDRRFVAVDCELEAVLLARRRLVCAGAELAASGRPPPDVAVESREMRRQIALPYAWNLDRTGGG
jgi:hypothetical protein